MPLNILGSIQFIQFLKTTLKHWKSFQCGANLTSCDNNLILSESEPPKNNHLSRLTTTDGSKNLNINDGATLTVDSYAIAIPNSLGIQSSLTPLASNQKPNSIVDRPCKTKYSLQRISSKSNLADFTNQDCTEERGNSMIGNANANEIHILTNNLFDCTTEEEGKDCDSIFSASSFGSNDTIASCCQEDQDPWECSTTNLIISQNGYKKEEELTFDVEGNPIMTNEYGIMTNSYISFDTEDDHENNESFLEKEEEPQQTKNQSDPANKESERNLKVHINVGLNLLRPVHLEDAALPSFAKDFKNNSDSGYHEMSDQKASYFLPSNLVKVVLIDEYTCAKDIINGFAKQFSWANTKLFHLYQRMKLGENKVWMKKVESNECIMDLLPIEEQKERKYLDYESKPPTSVYFVIKDHDESHIVWDNFSVPELKNFVKILDDEEKHKVEEIQRKYQNKIGILKSRLQSNALITCDTSYTA